jgi:hypothetical protein
MAPTVMQKMRGLSDRLAAEAKKETEKSDRCENQRKSFTWSSSALFTNRRETQRTSPSPHHELPSRHQSTIFLPHRLSTATSDTEYPSRWKLGRVRKPSPEDYHTESWISFHKKYSTKAHRTANMTFKEIEEQQRRELEPSIFVRCMCCFHPRSDQCDCGAARCDCNDASPKKSFASPNRPMHKRYVSTRYGK